MILNINTNLNFYIMTDFIVSPSTKNKSAQLIIETIAMKKKLRTVELLHSFNPHSSFLNKLREDIFVMLNGSKYNVIPGNVNIKTVVK